MNKDPMGKWERLADDVAAGRYERAEEVVRRVVDIAGSDSHESDESAPKPAKTLPEERLARIAEAHSKNVTAGGMTSGDCNECGHSHPCPTYVWATSDQRGPLDTWDPADDNMEGW